MATPMQAGSLTPAARAVLDAAGQLFYDNGIAAVGVESVAAAAGVTKKTMYDQFGSKAALVVAYLKERDQDFRDLVASTVERSVGVDRVLSVFHALDEWMEARSPRGCAFVHAHGELVGSPEHPAHDVIRAEKAWLHDLFEGLVAELGVKQASACATQLVVLIEGATVLRSISDISDVVDEARGMADVLLSSTLTAEPSP